MQAIRTESQTVAIPVGERDGQGVYALIDAADAAEVLRYNWRLSTKGYVQARTNGHLISLHRLLLGLTYGDKLEGDHINGQPLDNRRSNLRSTTRAQNGQNIHVGSGRTSCFRGVSWHSRYEKWRAQGKINGRLHHLGYFKDEIEAAKAAAEWRRQMQPFSMEIYRAGDQQPDLTSVEIAPKHPGLRPGTSKHRGVSWHAKRGKWRAQARQGRRMLHLGYFDSESEAAEHAAQWYVQRTSIEGRSN